MKRLLLALVITPCTLTGPDCLSELLSFKWPIILNKWKKNTIHKSFNLLWSISSRFWEKFLIICLQGVECELHVCAWFQDFYGYLFIFIWGPQLFLFAHFHQPSFTPDSVSLSLQPACCLSAPSASSLSCFSSILHSCMRRMCWYVLQAWVGEMQMRDVWRCSTTACGALCATTRWTLNLPTCCVGS